MCLSRTEKRERESEKASETNCEHVDIARARVNTHADSLLPIQITIWASTTTDAAADVDCSL